MPLVNGSLAGTTLIRTTCHCGPVSIAGPRLWGLLAFLIVGSGIAAALARRRGIRGRESMARPARAKATNREVGTADTAAAEEALERTGFDPPPTAAGRLGGDGRQGDGGT